MKEFTVERMIKLSIQAVLGNNPKPASQAERVFLERLYKDIEDIRSSGGVIELPFEWPDAGDLEEDEKPTVKEAIKAAISQSLKGGAGSGNFGHAGRPGRVGGSAPKKGGINAGADAGYSAIRAEMKKPLPEALQYFDYAFDPERIPWDGERKESVTGKVKDRVVKDLAHDTGLGYARINTYIADWARDPRTLLVGRVLAPYLQSEFGASGGDSEIDDALRHEWEQEGEMAIRQAVADSVIEHVNDPDVKAALIGGRKQDALHILLHKSKVIDEKNDLELANKKFSIYSIAHRAEELAAALPDLSLPEVYMQVAKTRKIDLDLERSEKEEVRKLAKAVYEKTQAKFAELGYKPDDEILLYRGVSIYEGREKLIGVGYRKQSGHIGAKVKPVSRVIGSWTLRRGVARGFARMYTGKEYFTRIFAKKFKVKDIFSTARTGFGCYDEAEIITFNTEDPAYVVGF